MDDRRRIRSETSAPVAGTVCAFHPHLGRSDALSSAAKGASMQRKDPVSWLYTAKEPHESGLLPVSDLHTIYWEESGNRRGKPVVFLHGGPGDGTNPRYRRFFDPDRYRIVLFDQRGCGKSTPYAEVRENTTWDLVADIERLRAHLGIETW